MLNSKGEVADFLNISQFLPGKSAYECVAYSAALCNFAGLPGHGATGTAQQASNLAQYWYGREEGSTDASNKNGMSLQAMYDMLKGLGLTYQPLVENIGTLRSTIEHDGLPVMLCGAETGMHDLALGDRVPYAWTPTGNHCIVVSGVNPLTGNFLVHDCANVDNNGVRPGPRVYDASKLQIVSATAVHLKGAIMSGIPSGWTDNGSVLVSPSSTPGGPDVHITGRMRDYVLANNWPSANVAMSPSAHKDQLELSNKDLGPGWQQTFRWSMLGIPDTGSLAGKVVWEWLGQELEFARHLLTLAAAHTIQLEAEIAALQAQLAASHDPAAVANRLTALAQLGHQVEALATQQLI